jgi:hypothetical protein
MKYTSEGFTLFSLLSAYKLTTEHQKSGGDTGICIQSPPNIYLGVQRLAKKGQNGYSRSITGQNDSSYLNRKFKQSRKKHVKKIKESKASQASSASKANETIATKGIDTIADTRSVDEPCSICQSADAHG